MSSSILPSIEKHVSVALFRTLMLNPVRWYWDVKLLNPEKLPAKGPCFIYGNHSNMLDAFILNCFTPWNDPTAGVLTREFYRNGFLKWALGTFDVHPTRKRLPEPGLIRTVKRMVDNGRKIVIYPEGGARWSGEPMLWIETTAKIFLRSGIPVYPVITHGSYVSWPRWADHPRRAKIEIEVLDPIELPRSTPFEEALAIYKKPLAFDECRVPDHLKPSRAKNPAAGIHRLLYRDPDTGEQDGLVTTDGTAITNTSGSISLTMNPDSSVMDARTGETSYLSDWYNRITQLPLLKSSDGSYLNNIVEFNSETEFPNLLGHGTSQVYLYDDHITVSSRNVDRTIEFDKIIGIDVERNRKLQVYYKDEMFQLDFTGTGSALGWHNAIQQLTNSN